MKAANPVKGVWFTVAKRYILDEAEVHFPFEGLVEFKDAEENQRMTLDAAGTVSAFDDREAARDALLSCSPCDS